MGGIAHGEGGGNREGIDRHGLQGKAQCCLVEQRRFIAVVVMAAGDQRHGHAGEGFCEADTIGHRLVETNQHHADLRTVTFDDGIGGERCRYRDQRNILRVQALRQFGDGSGDGAGDTDRQVALGGDGFRRGDDLVGGGFDDRRIGVGAAGIDADQIARRAVISPGLPLRRRRWPSC